jgi:peroxiredoxin
VKLNRKTGTALLIFLLPACEASPPSAQWTAEGLQLEVLEPAMMDTFAETADPTLAIDPQTGDLLIAWGGIRSGDTPDGAGWNLYLSRSRDAGRTFSLPVQVNDIAGDLHPHAEGAPRLVVGPEGTLALFWNNRIEVEGRRFASSDLRFSRSVDGGAQWSSALTIQDPVTPEGLPPRAHTFHGAAWGAEVGLVVAWLDGRDRDARRLARAEAHGFDRAAALREPERFTDPEDPRDGDAAVYAAVSTDGGVTWEATNRRIWEGICPCCRVTLVPTPSGGLVGAWRQHLDGGVRDLVALDLFTDGARPVPLHSDGWVFPGCPHSGPSLDSDPLGTLHAAWYTGAPDRTGVHYAKRQAGEPTFSDPIPVVVGESVGVANPDVVALDDGGAVIALNVAADGRRVIGLIGISASGVQTFQFEVPGSEGGTHPQLAKMDDGRILVAWTQSQSGVQAVRMARFWPAPPDTPRRSRTSDAPVAGNPAPAWDGVLMDGRTLALSDFRNEVVVLNVWATWCIPCLKEMPGLNELHAYFEGRGVTVLGVSVDRKSAAPEVARFASDLGITFPIALDPDQRVMSIFRTIGVPETFLIGPDGIIAHRWIGAFEPMDPEVLERVEALLSPSSSSRTPATP